MQFVDKHKDSHLCPTPTHPEHATLKLHQQAEQKCRCVRSPPADLFLCKESCICYR